MFNTYGSCGTSAYTGASMTISIKRDFDWRSFTNLLSCLVTRTHISAIHTRNKYRSCCYSREIALSIKCRRGRKTKTTQKKKEPKKSFVNQAHPRETTILLLLTYCLFQNLLRPVILISGRFGCSALFFSSSRTTATAI
jgi:hypothetical protein